jgi:transposase
MPALPIERGRPGPGLITHVVVSKFCDHIPLHRQAGISLRQGVELDRSTLADWVGQALFLLAPLADAIGRHVRAGVALHGIITLMVDHCVWAGGWDHGAVMLRLGRTSPRSRS